jgi:hypothetical protein
MAIDASARMVEGVFYEMAELVKKQQPIML